MLSIKILLSNLKLEYFLSLFIVPIRSAAPNFPRLNKNCSIKIFPLINFNLDSKDFIKDFFEIILFVENESLPFNLLLILNKFFLFSSFKLISKL